MGKSFNKKKKGRKELETNDTNKSTLGGIVDVIRAGPETINEEFFLIPIIIFYFLPLCTSYSWFPFLEISFKFVKVFFVLFFVFFPREPSL